MVWDGKPWHGACVEFKFFKVSICGDKNDFKKLIIVCHELIVCFYKLGSESTARRAPMCTKVKAYGLSNKVGY